MSKIVFFDIDGTLLDHEKKLPTKTKEAIKLLQEAGVYVAIATGRAPFMFEHLRKELAIESFVSFNGQYVVFENELIYANPIERSYLDQLLTFSQERDHPLVVMNENTMKSTVDYHRYVEAGLGSLKFPHPKTDAEFYLSGDIFQVLLFCEAGREQEYVETFDPFHFIRWHPFSVDILPKGGSKAEGITKMIERLGFKQEDVYAFGDGLNDLEMIKAVGTGVVMGNGVEELKKHADLITKDVAEDGIWHGLKELGLI